MLVRDVKPGDYFTLAQHMLGSPSFVKLADRQPNNYNVINCSSWALGRVHDDEKVLTVFSLTVGDMQYERE